ncbi:MoxR family ATPase [Iamia sp.]|uniref:AAA family ATPase n=1 Tax=Iamia sp. TaxID=2722710 RepID=UPI002D1202E5|nr:MoxR family ATPase [Iamia sp.]HXH56671.1 MoxR family ATPase [Iamia sp.]
MTDDRPTDATVVDVRRRLGEAVAPVVVGAGPVLDALVVALAVGGHVLLEGVPGVAKTLVAEATARALGARFRRAQFTPDMLPSDLTGTMTLRDGDLTFRPGPVFTNVLLADEINRTPPKTQAALLEAMGEGQVTVDGSPRRLADPFLVVATQNPIEYEGTYPLPEAELDRFLMKVEVGYPTEADEAALLRLARRGLAPAALGEVRPIVAPDAGGETVGAVAALVAALRAEVDQTTVSDEVGAYLLAVIRRTRELPSVEVGASPRAGVHLLAAAKGTARLAGRGFVTPDDIVEVAPAVLRHRLVLRAEAELERFRPDDAVAAAIAAVSVPR